MKLLIPLSFVILIRFILTFAPSFMIDMQTWLSWSERLTKLQPWHFYNPLIWTNYTPGYLFILWLLGLASNQLLNISFHSQTFEIMIKLLSNIFDVATTLLIFHIIKKHTSQRLALIGSLCYLFNPAVIFNSSVWGQIDGLLTFFLLLAFYLLQLKRIHFSLPVFIFSLLVKPQALVEFPLYILLTIREPIKKIAWGIITSLSIWLFFSLLFFPTDIIFGLPKLILQMLKDYPYTSLYAFNIWALLGWWQSDLQTWNGLFLQNWGLLLYLISLLLILAPVVKKSFYKAPVNYYVLTLLTFSFFLFPTRIHERYLLPFFAFLLIVAFIKKSKKLVFFYLLMSAVHLYNLWYVYSSANNNSYYYLSTISLVVFIFLLKDYYQTIYAKK